jgi:hypothetical protein
MSDTTGWQMVDAETGGAVPVLYNDSEVATKSVYEALRGPHPEVAEMVKWSMTTHGDTGRGRMGSLFQRDRYITPDRLFDQFRVAYDAAESDDVVSGILDSTEALAFNRISFSAEDEDEEDIWNQILFDLDLETRLREMWRELFICSQFYAVTWWGTKSYKVRGKTPKGVARKKTFDNLAVPLGVTILDPTKVTPVGNLMFNQDQLAYVADRTEVDMLDAAVMNDPEADPVSRQIIMGKYAPTDMERRNLNKLGINADWLYILNPVNVWRHTLTRSQYERFAKVRMKSVFELLDLKQQLRQMDRAHLIGGTNFIVLIKKGTDNIPAKPEEISQLRGQVTTVSRVPILVGDHRLSVEIVTPKMDLTLNQDKYAAVNSPISTRLYTMFMIHGGSGQPRSDDSVKLAKVIARGLESRRQSLGRTLQRRLVNPTVSANPGLTSIPSLRFHPNRIELDFDPATQTFIQDARDRGDLSRDTFLNELDFDQETEALNRMREARDFDHIFVPTNVPWGPAGSAPEPPVGPNGEPYDGPALPKPTVPGGTPPPTPPPPGGVPAPAAPGAIPPHSHGPDGTPVALPAKPGATPAKPGAKPAVDPKSAGRKLGGTRNGGGAAPGTGQGKAPVRGKPKNT